MSCLVYMNVTHFNTGIGAKRWPLCKEVAFQTQGLATNKDSMSIDILGHGTCDGKPMSVAIELKYVTTSLNQNNLHKKPSDSPAFSYDIIKDCVKIELAMSRKYNIHTDNISHPHYGIYIGLTNWPNFWNAHNNTWSRQYQAALLTPQLPHLMRTITPNINKALLCRRRNHISLSHCWSVEWNDYSGFEKYSMFKYVLCRTDITNKYEYIHTELPDNYMFIPYLNGETKNKFIKESEKYCDHVRQIQLSQNMGQARRFP